jgi:xanthine/uracil permease
MASATTTGRRPAFSRSASPPMLSATWRFFPSITVGFDTATRSTMSLTGTPSVASNKSGIAARAPTWLATIFESGISAMAIFAVLLNLAFNHFSKTDEPVATEH